MPAYAQLDSNHRVHTVCLLSGEIAGQNIVPISDTDDIYIGKKYDQASGAFYGLQAAAPKNKILVNEEIAIEVSWRDLNGNLVAEQECVKAKHGSVEEAVNMANGQGTFLFSAAVPGTYRLEIYSEQSRCITSLEVAVE